MSQEAEPERRGTPATRHPPLDDGKMPLLEDSDDEEPIKNDVDKIEHRIWDTSTKMRLDGSKDAAKMQKNDEDLLGLIEEFTGIKAAAAKIGPTPVAPQQGSCWAFGNEAPTTTAGCKFGGFLCPVLSETEFKMEADRIRELCKAERARAESDGNQTPARLLVDNKPVNNLNEATQRYGGWQLLSIAIDSGAAETVIPHKLVSQHPIMPTRDSQAGLCYASATGQPIPNLGEQRLPLFTNEGSMRGMTFQAAPVSKPLGSVKRICGTGHRVVFDEEGSFIQNKTTGEINWLREEEGNYILDVWIIPAADLPQDNGAGFGWQP